MAALVAVGVIAVVVATGSGLGLSDTDRLKQEPEASLFFPGSVLLREGGNQATGEASAAIWKRLATEALMGDVLSFYERELAARGWATGGGSSVGSTLVEAKTCAWHTENQILRLSFWRPAKFRERFPDAPDYPTVYELALIDRGSTSNLTACTIGIGE